MAIVKKYKSRIVTISSIVEGVYTLELESLGKPFRYEPGQFLHLTVDEYDPSLQWPDSRCFSMQSNPTEANIKITYSVKGKFTKKMKEILFEGREVWLKLPYGELFTKPHNKKDTVFIAGGTGITPFLSLFTHHSFNEYINPHIYLGFRSKVQNIYKNELDRLINPTKTIDYFYEDINGLIDIKSIFSRSTKNCDYFISGPPIMIKTFKNELIAKGVDLNHILTDDWE